ncbi:nitrite reductase, copper-containing [Candidatus Acetothermia bacterium]|nr:nitrite reductase, copper-containing [Candidatus Acetothermia bacterium]MBI3661293.1 nitrite reductase, copper-containing [Candidatus Acetothermia bacterium]
MGFQQGCTSHMNNSKQSPPASEHMMSSSNPASQTPPQESSQSPAEYTPNVTFTLKTSIAEGKLVFMGVGGKIDGVNNPMFNVKTGDVVQVNLVNGDGAEHDLAFPDFSAKSDRVMRQGASSTIVFRADKKGEFFYFCTVPGHRQAGMEGQLVVGEGTGTTAATRVSIARDPVELPPALKRGSPQIARVDLETVELEGRLADGTTYTYWSYNGKVPGPFLRVRVGDTVEVHLKNNANSRMIHSVDFHGVTGPGGGAILTQTPPGTESVFTFKALNPGLYVYHCATPMVAQHIASGMYGLILVEPEKGLSPVDREFYVMQGEIYTQEKFGKHGHLEFSVDKLMAETPEYFVFNGAVGALTQEHPLKAKVGETVRIFFGVGGPNLVSSFHVIGEIFDRVYDQAGLTAAPLTDVQTTLVPPGGATMVEFKIDVPGRYILVDHALSRLEQGLVGFLFAEGPDNPEVFHKGEAKK